jgi:hypothetical protein
MDVDDEPSGVVTTDIIEMDASGGLSSKDDKKTYSRSSRYRYGLAYM